MRPSFMSGMIGIFSWFRSARRSLSSTLTYKLMKVQRDSGEDGYKMWQDENGMKFYQNIGTEVQHSCGTGMGINALSETETHMIPVPVQLSNFYNRTG